MGSFCQSLKLLHTIQIPLTMQQKIRKETFSDEWRNNVKELLNKLDTSSYKLKYIQDKITLDFLAIIKNNIHVIKQLITNSDKFAKIFKKQPLDFVLCHSDIHAGNILIDNNKIYIVDWDNPIMAPKERDLMFIGAGVGNVWNEPNQDVLFYKGYGETKINHNLISYYRNERIVEDIAEYSESLLYKTENKEEREIMFQQFLAMFEPNGVINIALKTQI